MAKDDFKAHVVGFEYSNIDGTGWPDSVELENGKPFMVDGDINDEYEQRTYYPVDVKALLALADGLEKDADNIISAARNAQFTGGGPRMEEVKHDAYEWRCIARRIRKALGVEHG